ncbi:MAG: isochorismatase family protein [Bacteroides sp.]|nr:isochorismatase family protein [Bacteroides sp.]
MERMLIIVDPQVDFVSGTLPVPGAEKAMAELALYIKERGNDYSVIVITADSHPFNHSSFADCGGLWQRHCVHDSVGAAIVPEILEAAYSAGNEVVVMHKGENVAKEEYSVFQAPGAAEQIKHIIDKHNITDVDICGLAGDVCVLSTLKDAMSELPGQNFRVLSSFSPCLDGGEKLSSFINENSTICAK